MEDMEDIEEIKRRLEKAEQDLPKELRELLPKDLVYRIIKERSDEIFKGFINEHMDEQS